LNQRLFWDISPNNLHTSFPPDLSDYFYSSLFPTRPHTNIRTMLANDFVFSKLGGNFKFSPASLGQASVRINKPTATNIINRQYPFAQGLKKAHLRLLP